MYWGEIRRYVLALEAIAAGDRVKISSFLV